MKENQDQSIERVLESAVVVNWADLMPEAPGGLMHIEYGFSPNGILDHLKFLSSVTWGYWLLACSYEMSPSNIQETGVHFDNGYRSEGLAKILSFVMQHQNAYALPPNLGWTGLLQITTPTETEKTAAAASISAAFNSVNN